MLRCRDGSLYIGSTRSTLEQRIAEHNSGRYPGYTSRRLPVTLIWSEWFVNITDAIAAERQIKGWRRDKKLALARGDLDRLPELSRRGAVAADPSRRR
jgi:putative endonuclease